jgi:hypothetical protein
LGLNATHHTASSCPCKVNNSCRGKGESRRFKGKENLGFINTNPMVKIPNNTARFNKIMRVRGISGEWSGDR